MVNGIYLIYVTLLDKNHINNTGLDLAAFNAARECYLSEMAAKLRQNDIRRAKEMAFELLIFDNWMNDKFLETTKEENISVQLSVIV